VDDALLVRGLQRVGDLSGNREGICYRKTRGGLRAKG
jgi:hypothetical protein